MAIALAGLLAALAAASLGWHIRHDSPVLAYLGWLVDRQGVVPYRDLFEVNLPGTLWAFALIDRVFGPGYLGYRLADLLILGAILALTRAWLAPVGPRAAWFASLLFGVLYLCGGTALSLQREVLILLPLALSLALTTRWPGLALPLRGLLVGLGFGLAALVKPQALLSLPPCILFAAAAPVVGGGRGFAARLAVAGGAAAAGVALPVVAATGWLVATGAYPAFVEIVTRYLPLYASLSGLHRVLLPAERGNYLLVGWLQLGGHRLWLLPAAVGVWAALRHSTLGRRGRGVVLLAVALTATASVFPVISGQFFPYHWLPLVYFLCALTGLSLAGARPGAGRLRRWLPALGLVSLLVMAVRLPREFMWQLTGTPPPAPLNGRVDQIAYYLSTRLSPGDTVQPLDWTGGALHAMWEARARLATRFPYDFQFYHHVSRPYIQSLRREFMAEMRRAKPRFIIWVGTEKPWVSGPDTNREFLELDTLMVTDYAPDMLGQGYMILRRSR